MAGEITLHQLFQTPTIRRVVSRIKTPISLFQRFYGMAPGGTAVETYSGRNLGWDLFDFTRSIAKGRPPGTGPASVSPKAIGHVSAQAYRAHEKITLEQERIFRIRPAGAAIGAIDTRGSSYIGRQIQFLTQRFRNSREFMISRLFRGGFGLKMEGEDWIPVEMDDPNAITVINFQHPSDQQGFLTMGTGAPIINEPWNDPGSDVVRQVLAIDKAFERVNGRPMRHIWINGTTFGWLLDNMSLHKIGGEAFRIFESMSRRAMTSEDGLPETGYDVVFRALPLHTFHIYNGVLTPPGEEVSYEEAISVAGTQLVVPDNRAIFTPEPGSDWIGWAEASEVVAENVMDPGREVFGFHSWITRIIDPAGWELKMIDNGLPLAYIPRAWAYGTIAPDA